MISKIILWFKNPDHYTWIKSPAKLSLVVLISVIATSGIYFAFHGLKADELAITATNTPNIIVFSAPTTSTGKDYLIKVQVKNVTNSIKTVSYSTTGISYNPPAACVLYSGITSYPIRATGNNIPLTTIHRADFADNWGQTHSMDYSKETITLNCTNGQTAANAKVTVRQSDKSDVPTVQLTAPAIANPSLILQYSWSTQDDNGSEVCGKTTEDSLSEDWATPSGEAIATVTDSPIFVQIFCRNENEDFINFSTGQVIFVNPLKKQWRLDFTAPTEIKPNTDFQVQYAVYDDTGKKQKVGTTCLKSGDWKGNTLDGAGTVTIKGWSAGSKTFTLLCYKDDDSMTLAGPVSHTVTVVDRNLTFTVDGQNLSDGSTYQPPSDSSVKLAWQYKGAANDTCAASSTNAKFNGPIATSGQVAAGQYSTGIAYTITCATEKKTINVLAQTSTPPPTPPSSKLDFNINTTDYSSTAPQGIYQLKNNKFTATWKLTPALTGNACSGSGDIAAWNTSHPSTGSQTLTNISGTKTITLICKQISKSITVNYSAPTPDPFVFKVMGRSYKDFPNEYVTKGSNVTLDWAYTGTASGCTLWTKNKDNPGTTQNPLGTKATVAKSGHLTYTEKYDSETKTLQCGTSQGAVTIIATNSGGTVKIH